MTNDGHTYERLLGRLVNESDTAGVLQYMAIHDTVRTALIVAVAEQADIARTIADRVLHIMGVLACEADLNLIERQATDEQAVHVLVEAYGDEV